MSTRTLSRRNFLTAGTATIAGATAAALALPEWMPRLAFAEPYDEPPGDVLVAIFLRGGADSLNMIVPYGDDNYYRARPVLAIPRPDDNGAAAKVLRLDDFFGLHPALSPLLPVFQAGQMLAVHATGAPHGSRSHFEAMDFMERGAMGEYHTTTGWIGRHLAGLRHNRPSPVRGVGWGTALPTSMSGAPSTVALKSIIDYHLNGNEKVARQQMQALMGLYALEADSLYATAQATQAAVDVIAGVGYQQYQPRNGATYPDTDFGMALRQTAALIRADVGLEAACVDLGGWDTHANQGGAEGTQADLMKQLADGLAVFNQDMGTDMAKVSVVVMSEFGRRVVENASRGTDHGHGEALLVMSGNLESSVPVYTRGFSLAPEALNDGDLAITTDYRDILSELLAKRLKNPEASGIFPDYAPNQAGLFGAS